MTWIYRSLGRASALALCGALAALPGCGKDAAPEAPAAAPEPQLARGRLFRLELEDATVDRVVGSGGSAKTLRNVLKDHGLLVWTPDNEASIAVVGLTGAAGSFATSRYVRVKRVADPVAVRLEPFRVELQLRDGRRLELDVTSCRLVLPGGGAPADGVLDKQVQLEARGTAALSLGDTRVSAGLTATWIGGRDPTAPDVAVIPPPSGFVTGKVEIYFDEPVRVERLAERFALRDGARNPLEIEVRAEVTDLHDATTHITLAPRSLLPFQQSLTVSVSADVTDLVGRPLERTITAAFDTSGAAPLLLAGATDFAAALGDDAVQRVGDVTYLPVFGVDVPQSGRFARLKPPQAVAGEASALIARLIPPGAAKELRLRVRKVARIREGESPCLTVVLAQPSGVPWSVDCAVTEAPWQELAGPGGTWFATPWTDVAVPLTGQRGVEVLLAIDAAPLRPGMNPAADVQFLIDRLGVVNGP